MSPNSQVSKPVVFISYSHLDKAWKDLMLPHFKHLERLGVLEVWNDRDIGHGADWYAVLEDKLEQTRFAVCLVSANFLSSRFCMEEEIPYLLQRQAERGVVVLPVLVEDCLWEAERWLSRTQMLPRDKQNLTTHFRDDPAPIFKQVAKTIYDALQPDYVAPSPAPPAGTPPEKIDINRLPETGELLFGRREEMTLLDEAWDSDKTNVVVLKAGGGVGKSTLMRVWTKSLQQDNFRGAERVFAWSFYSQGTGERVTSADMFIANALDWFGDPDSTAGSPWDKGERLARLVAEQRTLLLLDGMEPLQSHVKEENGAIKDPGLQMLVRDLARHNPGLCVISTRETVGDLTDSRLAGSVVHEDLEHVSLVAGRALMRVRGVHGEDSALEATVEHFDRHALAINLLASYLTEFENGDISRVQELPRPRGREVARRAGEGADHPARRVIAAFEQRLQDTPELNLLCILGLFDRPITGGEFQAITAEPPIPGLTDKLLAGTGAGTGLILPAGASLVDRRILERLRKFGLSAAESHHEPHEIDTHPLIREYFAARLDEDYADAAREAHRRLYEHLKQSTQDLPDNLNAMMPLYHAVVHGCKAGMHQEAIEQAYYRRILRKTEQFSCKMFGAHGLDLSVITFCFESPWRQPVDGLTEQYHGFVLGQAGLLLKNMGRLTESIEPLRASFDDAVERCNWRNAARAAVNLSEQLVDLGSPSEAVSISERGIELSDRCDMDRIGFEPVISRATLGHVLHQVGRWRAAARAFRDAETMQQVRQPELPLLYSAKGSQYGDFLVSQIERQIGVPESSIPGIEKNLLGQVQEIQSRFQRISEWTRAQPSSGLFDSSLDLIVLGRACLVEAVLSGSLDWTDSDSAITQAIGGFRRSNYRTYLTQSLICRAKLRRLQGLLVEAVSALDEAETIAERGSMLIWQIEAALERTRLYLTLASVNSVPLCFNPSEESENTEAQRSQSDWLKMAREKLDETKRLVKQTEKPYEPHVPDWDDWEPPEYVGVFQPGEIVGYHCRNDEIERLQKQIG